MNNFISKLTSRITFVLITLTVVSVMILSIMAQFGFRW